MMQRTRGVSDQMAKGVEYLFKKNKVDYVVGKAQIEGAADAAIKRSTSPARTAKHRR